MAPGRGKGGRLGSGGRLASQTELSCSARCEGPTPREGPEEGSSGNTDPVLGGQRSTHVPQPSPPPLANESRQASLLLSRSTCGYS